MTSFSPASFDQTAPDLSSLIWLGEQVLDEVLADIGVFADGVPQFDDITMVVLSVKE